MPDTGLVQCILFFVGKWDNSFDFLATTEVVRVCFVVAHISIRRHEHAEPTMSASVETTCCAAHVVAGFLRWFDLVEVIARVVSIV